MRVDDLLKPKAIRKPKQAPEDVVARVAAMQNWHDLEGASVVVFGDDDLMGIALAMSGLPREVVVLEIDLRIVERVKAFAAKHELATLHAHQYNLLEALPSEFQRRFDIFVTDPVESVEGLNITLSRAALSLVAPSGHAAAPLAQSHSNVPLGS